MPSRGSHTRNNGENLDKDTGHKRLLSDESTPGHTHWRGRRTNAEQHGRTGECRPHVRCRRSGKFGWTEEARRSRRTRAGGPGQQPDRPFATRRGDESWGAVPYAVRAEPASATAAPSTSSTACSIDASRPVAWRAIARASTRPVRPVTAAESSDELLGCQLWCPASLDGSARRVCHTPAALPRPDSERPP
jgi:hypothetical protein